MNSTNSIWLIRCFGKVKRVAARPAIEGELFRVFGYCERIKRKRDSSVAFPAKCPGVAGAKPISLSLIKTAFRNVAGTRMMAFDAIGPTHLTNLFKALSIVHQKQKRESHPWQPIVAGATSTPKT